VAGRGAHWPARQPDPHLGEARQPTHGATRSALPVGLSVRRGLSRPRRRRRAGFTARQCSCDEPASTRNQHAGQLGGFRGAHTGWHQVEDRLRVPDNIGLLHLPPYSPELNPVETLWEFLRHNDLSNRMQPTRRSWAPAVSPGTKLIAAPARIRSIAPREYAKTVNS
jgi:hypothetical protein